MKEKKNCKIIQDLLPNYIDKLTSEETNEYSELHLKECLECNQIFNNMSKKIDFTAEQRKKSPEVKYIKKFNKRLKLLRNIILLILLVFVIVIGRKTIILTNISNKINSVKDTDNYYIKSETFVDGEMIISETYQKDNKVLIKKSKYSKDGKVTNNIIYKVENEKFMLENNGEEKTLIKLSDVLVDTPSFNSKNFFENIKIAFTTSIRKTKIKGIDCYVIREDDTEKFIDINTGLTVKMIYNDADSTINYEYKYGVVQDNDIVRPDTTDYKVTKF